MTTKRCTFGGQAAIFIGDVDLGAPDGPRAVRVHWADPATSEAFAYTGDVIDLPWDQVATTYCIGPVPDFGVWPFLHPTQGVQGPKGDKGDKGDQGPRGASVDEVVGEIVRRLGS